MNKMPEIAALLGVELEQEFIAKYPKGKKIRCKFYKDYFMTSDTGELWAIDSSILYDLIAGKCKIHRLPWRAKNDDVYFVPLVTSTDKCVKHRVKDYLDDTLYQRGLMCRTRKQAEAIADAMINVARKMQGFDVEKHNKIL